MFEVLPEFSWGLHKPRTLVLKSEGTTRVTGAYAAAMPWLVAASLVDARIIHASQC